MTSTATSTSVDDLDRYLIISPTSGLVVAGGWPADSDDTLYWLTPVIGTPSPVLLHRLATYLRVGNDTIGLPVADLAASLGVPPSKLRAAVTRLVVYGYLTKVGTGWKSQ